MRRTALILLVPALLAATAAFAAEVVKLRPTDVLYADGKGTSLREPHGIACGKGSIVVADSSNGRLVSFAVSDKGLTPAAEFALPEVPFPIRVDVTPTGGFLVLDGRSRRIARLDASGKAEGWLEPSGEPAPGAIVPRSFAVDGAGRIYVLDVGGSRVLVLDSSGRVERSIAFATDRGFPSDVAVDGRGDVYVVDSVRKRVDVARKGDAVLAPLTSSLAQDLDFPTAIAADDEGRLFLVDEHGGGIVVIGRDGSYRGRQLAMGWKDGFLRYPSDACLSAGGLLAVADRGNNRAQTFAIAR